jgi:hypothetical protein
MYSGELSKLHVAGYYENDQIKEDEIDRDVVHVRHWKCFTWKT